MPETRDCRLRQNGGNQAERLHGMPAEQNRRLKGVRCRCPLGTGRNGTGEELSEVRAWAPNIGHSAANKALEPTAQSAARLGRRLSLSVRPLDHRTSMSNDSPASNKATWLLVVLLVAVVGTVAAFRVFPKRARATSAECRARLSAIGAVARAFSATNQGRFPADYESFRSLSSGAGQPQSWVCPADSSNPMRSETDWSRFRPEHASYELVSPGTYRSNTTTVFARCRIHGHECYTDGSVRDGKTTDNNR